MEDLLVTIEYTDGSTQKKTFFDPTICFMFMKFMVEKEDVKNVKAEIFRNDK